jgi:hypothetical protein
VILVVLVVATVASLLKTRGQLTDADSAVADQVGPHPTAVGSEAGRSSLTSSDGDDDGAGDGRGPGSTAVRTPGAADGAHRPAG